MAALPPQMQKYMAMMLQQGGGGNRAPTPAPIGGPPSPIGTQFPPELGGPARPPSAVQAPPTRGPFPAGYSPQPMQGGPPPAGPGGGGTGIPMTPPQPGAGNRNVPPGAGGMFGPGSTAPMNEARPTPRPPNPGVPGPAGGGAGGQIANVAANVQGGPPMDASAIAAIDPSVFGEQQDLMNKQRAQANWLQGGAGIDDEGRYTRGKYGTYTAANPLSHAAKAYARGKGGKDVKRLTKEEKEQIGELKGMRKKVGDEVRKKYGMAGDESGSRKRLPVDEYTFE